MENNNKINWQEDKTYCNTSDKKVKTLLITYEDGTQQEVDLQGQTGTFIAWDTFQKLNKAYEFTQSVTRALFDTFSEEFQHLDELAKKASEN